MRLILIIMLLLPCTMVIATQPNQKVSDIQKLFEEGKMDKSISMMEKIVSDEPSSNNWDIILNMYYKRYEISKKNTGAEAEKLTNGYYNELVEKCKTANLQSQSPIASQLLRNFFIDKNPTIVISEEAKAQYQQAEELFKKEDYGNAKNYYQNALNMQPNYYNATLYLGDSYWNLDKIDSAILYFNKSLEINPTALEPHIYLLDAYLLTKRYEEGQKEFINSLNVYPDETIFSKFAELNEKQGQKFNRHWIQRECDVNSINTPTNKAGNKIWAHYQNAKNEIKPYCDSLGNITKNNSLTNSKYLEVYSWEKMLKETNPLPEELAFAKKMYTEGYLDCYVFVSLFHFDLYNQYSDFVKNNQDKIKTYIDTYLIEK